MSKAKQHPRASDTRPAAASNGHKPRRGRPPKVTLATEPVANGAPEPLIAMPSKGPGRRRMVARDSIDGIAAQLAHELGTEIAIKLVPKLRRIAETMVRAHLAQVMARIG